jgi:hypothetical protein
VAVGTGTTDHDQTVAELEPGQRAVGVLHAGLPPLDEAECPHQELECGELVPVREPQALALLNNQVSMPADAEPAAKLVHTDTPATAAMAVPPGRLAWVVVFDVTPSGELGIVAFDATTGEFIFSTDLAAESWDRLVDLAP